MSNTSNKRQIYTELPDSQWRALSEISNKRGIKMGVLAEEMLTEAIQIYLEQIDQNELSPWLLLHLIHTKAKSHEVVKEQLIDLAMLALETRDDKDHDQFSSLCLANGVDEQSVMEIAGTRRQLHPDSIFETTNPDPVVRAKAIIRSFFSMARSEVPATEIISACNQAGISEGARKLAKQQLDVKASKRDKGWIWTMAIPISLPSVINQE